MQRDIVVILDNVRSAYNVGSMLRTIDSGGGSEAYLCGITAPPDNAKMKKTALGAEKYVATHYFGEHKDHRDTLAAIDELRGKGYAIYAIEQDGAGINPFAIQSQQFTDFKIALIMGNEVNGIHPEVLAACDRIMELPMAGQKESLNVCVAMGIVLYYFNYMV